MMPDFSTRSSGVEIMDDLKCSGEVLHQTLRELEFINKWLGGNRITLDALEQLCLTAPKGEITIADLGCGGGEMLRLIDAWGKKKNLQLKLIGLDANPNVIAFAKKNIADCPHIYLEAVNIFSSEFLQQEYDIVIGTLFFHHFRDAELKNFFRKLGTRVRLGYIINDIHRHWLAFYSIKILTRIFSRSPMVRYDAPLSVLRAFKRKELLSLLNQACLPDSQAGASQVAIRWRWAFRWQVVVRVAFFVFFALFGLA